MRCAGICTFGEAAPSECENSLQRRREHMQGRPGTRVAQGRSMRSRSKFSPGSILLTAMLLFKCVQPAAASSSTTTNDDNFREDVFACEEAVVRLEECCPDFDGADIKCEYYYSRTVTESACTGQTSYSTTHLEPAITMKSAVCIEATPCTDLVARGVCERAKAAKQRDYGSYAQGSSGSYSGSYRDDGAPYVEVCQ
jgi:hypothetical protein